MSTLDLRAEARLRAPRIDADPALNAAGRATWLGRMVNEYASSEVFAALARQLEAAGAPHDDVASCARFADEERHHGVLCGAVVEALGGAALAELPMRDAFPLHEDVPAMEGALRNAMSVGCLSETVAVSLIGAERIEMPEGALRGLLTQIWADEIGHARFGWHFVAAHVPALDAAAKSRLSRYLRIAFAHLEAHELAHLPLASCPPPEGAALGLCSGRDARVLFRETVTEVIVPRLEQLGLEARRAWKERHRVAAAAA